ncbi:hypothetical protein H0H93_004224, partial [Arthromyces matolae]
IRLGGDVGSHNEWINRSISEILSDAKRGVQCLETENEYKTPVHVCIERSNSRIKSVNGD